MFTLRKFLYRCVALGAFAYLGTTVHQLAAYGQLANMHDMVDSFDIFLQTAAEEAVPETDRTVADIAFKLQILSESARLFVGRNLVSGRLQLDYMANTVQAELAATSWIPTELPGWLSGRPQLAAQNAYGKATGMAGKVQVVNGAISATKSCFTALRAAVGF